MENMKKLIIVGLFALLIGVVCSLAAAREYLEHDAVAVKMLSFGLIDLIAGAIMLRKAYTIFKQGNRT